MAAILRAIALSLIGLALGAAGAMVILAKAEPPQRLPLIHAQLSLCRPLQPPPEPEEGPIDHNGRPSPAPDYQPRDTGEIA